MKMFKMEEVSRILTDCVHTITNVQMDVIKHPEYSSVASISVKINGTVFTFFEDEDDGYRSMLEDQIAISSGDEMSDLYHVKCKITYTDSYDFTGLMFFPVDNEDVSEEPFIEIGTDYGDSYYPCCIMRVNPLKDYTLEGVLKEYGFFK